MDKVQAEHGYQMLFREMMDGFALHEIICDDKEEVVDYRFLAVNPAFERLTELSGKSLIGKTVLEVMPQTEPHWIQKYGRVAMTGEPDTFDAYSRELGRHFQVRAFRPAIGQFACIFEDITELKQNEVRLQEAQKMESIGNLAGGIAHDFNNILFPIIGLSEVLMEDLTPGSVEHENMRQILKAAERGSDLVQQILAFSRQSEHRMLPLRLQQILKEVLKLMRATIPANIEIFQDIQSDCGLIMADATKLHQVVMNIMTNAYHAVEQTSASGSISVHLAEIMIDDSTGIVGKQGPYARLSISDTGSGIDRELMDKIFEPYFTTKKKGKGTGLGLAVVYGIVRGHGGDIKVYSEAGVGSTFHVYLPLMKKTFKSEPTAKKEKLQGGTERILLVDDEESIILLLEQVLKRLGYRVTTFVSSVEAFTLTSFERTPIGLIS
ncbi:MAG: PAS domain-containing protein [Deltaproteobacteria bacterium]|nr:PAS domain-containing protein [Deltaproteobacteria bacterium]